MLNLQNSQRVGTVQSQIIQTQIEEAVAETEFSKTKDFI